MNLQFLNQANQLFRSIKLNCPEKLSLNSNHVFLTVSLIIYILSFFYMFSLLEADYKKFPEDYFNSKTCISLTVSSHK